MGETGTYESDIQSGPLMRTDKDLKDRRRESGKAREKVRAKRSDEQQLQMLDAKFGKNVGASKE